MAEQFYTILTQIGKARIANANAFGTKIDLTTLVVGDSGGSYYDPTEESENVRNEVWRGNINSITTDEENPNWIVITTVIPSDIGGFMIREAAILDGEGNLIAIGKYPETYKPKIQDGSSKDLIIKMILEVSNSSSVTLKIDPTVILATKKDIQVVEDNLEIKAKQTQDLMRASIPSGVIGFKQLEFTMEPNKIILPADTYHINGEIINLPGQDIVLPLPPVTGERDDFVFLEVYKQKNASGKTEIKHRIRVVEGVDFDKYPEGFVSSNIVSGSSLVINPKITAQGANSEPMEVVDTGESQAWNIQTFVHQAMRNYSQRIAGDDVGLYVAGLGDHDSKTILGTTDGYVYAVPLFRVKRRNTASYSDVNPGGAPNFIPVSVTRPEEVAPSQSSQITVNSNYDKLAVGDILETMEGLDVMRVDRLDGNNLITVTNVYTSTIGAISHDYKIGGAQRPDSLHCDVIDERDIIDLRHKVSLTGVNYNQLLEQSFDKLLRGELQTKDKKQMRKTYHGVRKTPKDANTVFYASLDGTTTAEVGGAPTEINTTEGSGYAPMPTGLGGKATVKYDLTDIDTTELTMDMWVKTPPNTDSNEHIFTIYANDGNWSNENIMKMYFGGPTGTGYLRFRPFGITWDINMCKYKFNEIIHIRITVSNDKYTVYVNGESVYEGIVANINEKTINKLEITCTSATKVADFSISNIDRGADFATLPQDFISGHADITAAFSGQRNVHSDALTSQPTIGIARGSGSGHSYGVTATPGTWAAGDTVKVKGMAGELISGVLDSNTALARIEEIVSSNQVRVTDVAKLVVGDTVDVIGSDLSNGTSIDTTIIAIDGDVVTVDNVAFDAAHVGFYLIETTASNSSPIVRYSSAGVSYIVTGTWAGLGTNEATFTLGSNAGLVNADLQVGYGLNMESGQAGIPVVYTETLQGEVNGKKLIPGVVAVIDDFKGKVEGSIVENPNVMKANYGQTTLQPPTGTWNSVITTPAYDLVTTLNNNLFTLETAPNGAIPQQMFSFNLIRIVEDKYGPIPAADKVKWLKDNLNKIIVTYYGRAENPTDNIMYVSWWQDGTDDWAAFPPGSSYDTDTTNGVTKFTRPCYATNSWWSECMDINGFVHLLASTKASDGVKPSTIYTDYVNIEVELKGKTDYDMLVPENPRRDDGKAGVLLVRKETREIETYFPAEESDGVITWGDHTPYGGCIDGKSILDATISGKGFNVSGGNFITCLKNVFVSPFCITNISRLDLLPVHANLKVFDNRGALIHYENPIISNSVGVYAIPNTVYGDFSTNNSVRPLTFYVHEDIAKIYMQSEYERDLLYMSTGIYEVNGELYLGVSTNNDHITRETGENASFDLFKIEGRPLIKGV
ncbi:MAG: phage tail protein [Anaeromicrobium sp.]|uniref:phage tail-collar fiber domain-containing protein n=1 Tax=Anaeromicrobium sp. TaxID=1929132 RepID=UPI0025DF9CAE|nr:phage tail protein [Anaeromicrobium sp.]MCT4593193.1 phage tail protein [Anaeromicrobium sp.]